jgi:hypothetical protein
MIVEGVRTNYSNQDEVTAGPVYIVSTADGIYDSESFYNINDTQQIGYIRNPELTSHEGKIYEAISSLENNKIFTRYSEDGITWSPYMIQPGLTSDKVKMVSFNGKLYQNVRGESGNIFTRYQ